MTRMSSKSAIEMALLSAGSLVGSMGETSVVVSSESCTNTFSSNATAMLPHSKGRKHLTSVVLVGILQVSPLLSFLYLESATFQGYSIGKPTLIYQINVLVRLHNFEKKTLIDDL